MIIFAINFILVGLSSMFLMSAFRRKSGLADFSLDYFTIFLSEIIFITLILGLFGVLFHPYIILAEFVFLAFSFYIYKSAKEKPVFNKPSVGFVFESKIILLSLAVFISFFGYKLLFNMVNPTMCADSMQYHLSFPATWIQNGNLYNPMVIMGSQPTSAELTALRYYPMNAEFFFFWLMVPFRNAFLADIGEAPFYLIGILAIYSILRKFNLSKPTALLAGMLWALIPNLLKQIRFGSQVDVICAVLLLLVLNNLISWGRKSGFRNALFLGVSLGLLCGTKVLNFYWCIGLLPLAFYYLRDKVARRERAGSILFAISLILIAAFIFGGFTYVRTFLTTGNPLYPVKLAIFGKQIFPGFIDKETFSRIFVNWSDFSLKDMFFSEGLGAQFIFFTVFGTFIPFLGALLIRKKFDLKREEMALSIAPLIMFLLFIFAIRAYWIRYIFPYLAVGIISAFIFLNKSGWGRKYITFFGLACIFSSAAELAHRGELITCLSISFVLFLLALFTAKKTNSRPIVFPGLKPLLLLAGLIFFTLYFLNEKYDREEFNRIPGLFTKNELWQRDLGYGWKWLNENTKGGSRVAYTGRNEFYPLFGERLKNRVFYISVNDKPGIAHFYPDGLYRKEKVFGAWLDNLKESRIEYLFVALPQECSNESEDKKEFPVEDKWALAHPDLFRLVFSNTQVRIYVINQNRFYLDGNE